MITEIDRKEEKELKERYYEYCKKYGTVNYIWYILSEDTEKYELQYKRGYGRSGGWRITTGHDFDGRGIA